MLDAVMENQPPKYHPGPAKAALADLLRARGQVDALGNVTLERAYRAVEDLDQGYTAKHMRRMVDSGGSGRTLQTKALLQLSQVLDVEPTYWREYRAHQLEEAMERQPELVNEVYDWVMDQAEILEARHAKSSGGGRE